MMHPGTVEERISILSRGPLMAEMSKRPVLLEPRDVTDLPSGRVHDREEWHALLVLVQSVEQRERAPTSLDQVGGQTGCARIHGTLDDSFPSRAESSCRMSCAERSDGEAADRIHARRIV